MSKQNELRLRDIYFDGLTYNFSVGPVTGALTPPPSGPHNWPPSPKTRKEVIPAPHGQSRQILELRRDSLHIPADFHATRSDGVVLQK